nr:uncharacterized protein LOC119169543 [Rhipicephalus microplus]
MDQNGEGLISTVVVTFQWGRNAGDPYTVQWERHLHVTAEDDALLKFLRARKFNADRAFKVVKNCLKVREDNPQMLDHLSPSRIPFDSACREHGLVTMSRKTDPQGRGAVILRFECVIVHAMYLIHQEQFQVKGVVIVLDLKGLGVYHMAHYTPYNIFSLVQGCFPLRIKGVYIINNPAIFELFFAIDKHFMKSKLMQRPRSMDPGTNESYDYDVMEKKLLQEEEFFTNLNSYGCRKKSCDMSGVKPEPIASLLDSPEDVARKELGETLEVRQKALNELRQLISDEPSLRCPTDDAFLLKFLRVRKYDTQAAFKSVKKYFKFRTYHPEMFKDLAPSKIPFDAVCRTHRLITVSRHRDPMGRIAVMLKTGAWSNEICTLNDFFRVAFVLCDHFLLREDSVLNGLVVVLDVKGIGLYHLTHYTPSVIGTLISYVQDCVPIRLKAVYVINNPQIFDLIFGITKTFLKAKLVNRFRFFGYEPNGLHELVPDDVIPEEHGGTNERYNYDRLERELESEEGYFQQLGSYGYGDTPAKTEVESNDSLSEEIQLSEEYVHL